MRKWIIAGVILLLLCVALFVAVLNINSYIARNKEYLIARAEQALGRNVSVDDVRISLWNGIGFRLTNFAMSDDPAFSSDEFVRAKDLQVNLKFLPLLRKDFQVKKMILHDPVINLVRNKTGEFNFSTIGKNKKDKDEASKKRDKEAAPREKKASSAFFVSLVDISGGNLSYRDQKDGTHLQIRQINLGVEDLDFDRPFIVDLAAALFASKQNLRIKTLVGPLSQGTDFRDVPLEGEINIDPLNADQLIAAVPRVKDALPKNFDLAGVFKIEKLKLKGTLKNLAITGQIVGNDGSIRVGDIFRKERGLPLMISTDGQYAGDRIVLRQAELKLHNLELASKGELRLGDRTLLNLSVDSKPVSLAGWEKIIPAIATYQLGGKMEFRGTVRGEIGTGATPQIQGIASLENASAKPPQFSQPIENLNTKINFTGQRADIREMTLSLGHSKVRLAAAIEKFSPLALTYKLSTAELSPAEFQASLPEERKKDVIRNLSSEGQVRMQNGNLTVQSKIASSNGTLYAINYKDLQGSVSLADKVATVRNFRANAMSGALQAEGEYAFKDPVPNFSLASKVRGIDLKELYDTFGTKGESDSQRDIRGKLNGEMKVSGSGKNWQEMKPTLVGQGQAQVLEGALLNFNVVDAVLSSVTGMPGMASMIKPEIRKKYPETFEAKDTHFKTLKADFDLADGRMNIKNLRIEAADFGVDGNGWVDFDHRINFRSSLQLSPPLSADIAASARETKYLFNDQKQLEVPFTVSGRLPHVKPKPDTKYLARSLQRGFIQKGAEEFQQRFLGKKDSASPQQEEDSAPTDRKTRNKNSTEDLIRKGLKDFFGR